MGPFTINTSPPYKTFTNWTALETLSRVALLLLLLLFHHHHDIVSPCYHMPGVYFPSFPGIISPSFSILSTLSPLFVNASQLHLWL